MKWNGHEHGGQLFFGNKDEIDYNLGRDVGIKFRNGDVSKVLASVVYNAGV